MAFFFLRKAHLYPEVTQIVDSVINCALNTQFFIVDHHFGGFQH